MIVEEIYFARPDELNGPFECRPDLFMEGLPSEKNSYITYIASRKNPGRTRNERRHYIKHLKKNKQAYNKIANPNFWNKANIFSVTTGIFCLSEKKDNILLWAHYANAHKGVCLRIYGITKKCF